MNANEKTVEQLQLELAAERKINAENLVALHKTRGVVVDAETASLLTLALANYGIVKEMLEARVPATAAPDANEQKALALVQLHMDRGAITAAEKVVFEASAKLDYEATRQVLEAKQGRDSIQTFVAGMGNDASQSANNERASWDYLTWFKKDPEGLKLMAEKEPDKHLRLMANFEAESRKMGIGL